MKERLFHFSMFLIVLVLVSAPLYLVSLLDSKPGTTWMVTARFFIFVPASLLFFALLTLLGRFMPPIPVKPEIRNAAGMAVGATLGSCLVSVFPALEPRHEALGHIFQRSAVSLPVAFAVFLCLEFWRSSRKKRNTRGTIPNLRQGMPG
jgi:hypothetical protein